MRIPEHIGIIPDGNRRWAKQAGLAKEAGYAYGLTPGLELLRLARDAGVREITYYGFTTDNWRTAYGTGPGLFRRLRSGRGADRDGAGVSSGGGEPGFPVFPRALLPYGERRDLNGR